jgi:uncharacterized protein
VLDAKVAVFALIVLIGYAVQTITGFGSTLLLVTLGAHFMSIPEIVVLAVPLSVMQSTYIVARHHDGIDWRLLGIRVLPLMLGGMAIGFFALRGFDAVWLQMGFAILVLVLSVREVFALRRGQQASMPSWAGFLGTGIAGIVHGLFATGGPLLVYSLSRSNLDKHRFRSTLGLVWLVLDLALTVANAVDGRYDRQTLLRLAIVVPAMPLGVVIGELFHKRVNEKVFKYLVFGLLIAASLSLLLR